MLFFFSPDGQFQLGQCSGWNVKLKPKENKDPEKGNASSGGSEANLNDKEDKTLEQENDTADFDDEEELPEEYAPGSVHCDNPDRMEWTDRSKIVSKKENSFSVWKSLSMIPEEDEEGDDNSLPMPLRETTDSSTFTCPWDRLFADDEKVDKEGVDHLFGLFEDCESAPTQAVESTTTNSQLSPEKAISLSMLSQQGQTIANDIEAEVLADEKKLNSLQIACPNWKENVLFALFQKDGSSTVEALEQVKETRRRNLERKRKILEAWARQEAALDVFETALQSSLDRSKCRKDDPAPVEDGGFLTALSQEEEKQDVVMDEVASPFKCRAENDDVVDTTLPESGLLMSQ